MHPYFGILSRKANRFAAQLSRQQALADCSLSFILVDVLEQGLASVLSSCLVLLEAQLDAGFGLAVGAAKPGLSQVTSLICSVE